MSALPASIPADLVERAAGTDGSLLPGRRCMSVATWDQADVEARVEAEVQRLAGLSDYARRSAQRWWVRRLLQTAAHPGSAQHALACGVVDSLSRRTVAAAMRASGQPGDAAPEGA